MLGKCMKGTRANQVLAKALFTTSILESRRLLEQNIWSELDNNNIGANNNNNSVLNNNNNSNVILAAIDGGDDLADLKQFIESGAMKQHERINNINKIRNIIMDTDGPSLKDAIQLGKRALETKHTKMKALPATLEEERIKQLDDAIILAYGQPHVTLNPTAATTTAVTTTTTVVNDQRQWTKTSGNSLWVRTIWYRINAAIHLVKRLQDKEMDYMITLWERAHLPLIAYLDSLGDAKRKKNNNNSNNNINSNNNNNSSNSNNNNISNSDNCELTDEDIDVQHLASLYKPLGAARNHFTITKTTHILNETPLQMLEKAFPNDVWRVEQVVDMVDDTFASTLEEGWRPPCLEGVQLSVDSHAIYFACVYILNQCRQKALETVANHKLRDALWNYYVAFSDLFTHCTQWDDQYLLSPIGSQKRRGGGIEETDRLTPFELWGSNLDIRTFHAGDLPDLFHVIHGIPLWGEQHTPPYFLGKIYQKSLPFACQRRHIIELVTTSAMQDAAFWQLLSRLFWVTLLGLYPGQSAWLPMQDVVRAKELTNDREVLLPAVAMKDAGKKNETKKNLIRKIL